jgi:hypothetical protein
MMPSDPHPATPSTARFHVPFEHGAWWSFGSTLLGALGVALYQGADPASALALGFSLAAAFVAQDWAQALLAALLHRRAQALSQWQAPQGWALGLASLAGAGIVLLRQAPAQRPAWFVLFAVMGLATALGLGVRVFQSGRGRKSLAMTALLLASPALALGALSFGFGAKALVFWAWPLAFYPAATLAAQSFIRGFPEKARWAGPAGLVALGGLAAATEHWLAGGLLLLQGLRLQRAIQLRWIEQPQGLPSGLAIRSFGKEQAYFGVTLTLLWAWSFL